MVFHVTKPFNTSFKKSSTLLHTQIFASHAGLHNATLYAILRPTVAIQCGHVHPLEFDQTVAHNVAKEESDSISAILRAMMHATISVVTRRCNLAFTRIIASRDASCGQPFRQ